MDEIEIAFIGGSGLYQVPGLTNIKWKKVSSHFGNPSDKVCIGLLNNKKVAFLPRHGRKHKLSPSKINYRANIDCLKSLNEKGLIKIKNFKKNPNKLNYVYLLTPKGINEKTRLTVNFMKRKMREYDELKKEMEK